MLLGIKLLARGKCGNHSMSKGLLGLTLLVMALIVSVGTANAATITVDDSGGADYTTIQAAIDYASPGDEIHVNSGTYYENVVVNKQINLRGIDTGAGMPVVDAGGSGNVITISADKSLLEGFIIKNSGLLDVNAGIIITSNDNVIKNNEVTNNKAGISLESSSNNIVESNIVNLNSYPGVALASANNNIISNNEVNSNGYYGIELYLSSNNTVIDNIANSNTRYGIFVWKSDNDNRLISNTANNNVNAGIRFYTSSNNNVSDNLFDSNNYGISIYGSDGNIISENTISFNENGVFFDSSSNNVIYHNNITKNTHQASDNLGPNTWDDDYPSGGNYWSDYIQEDTKSGPNQDQPSSDGIGDIPYPIPGGSSVDRYPLMAPYSPPTIQDKSLFQVEDQPEVYWHQNDKLYWVINWDVIDQMSGIPGWDSVNTLPASEFDPAAYEQGPRFITTGYESNDLLIREQGHFEVYLILNGEKHHFTSPEALTWNGYGFDDVIDVSAAIVGIFPEGTPISLQDKKLLRKPGGIDVYWSQNGELYYVTADAMTKMQGIFGWGWDEIVEPADFNPGDPSSYKTFIATGPESDGILIRQWGDYQVYRIENGFRRHITYSDVMDLYGYSMDDVIDVSQDIMDMFLLGGPIGIEVNLSFSNKTDFGDIPYVTKFTTDDTIKFYTETTVSDSYTVDTYVKLTEPDGTERYAYYINPDFLPTDPLSFSYTEVPLYPDHWDAVSTNWNWNEYKFLNDGEGVYTWEFYYKDVISGKVVGWDREAYSFNKKTDLGIKLDIRIDKNRYNKNEHIIITADVYNDDGPISANDFLVIVDRIPQDPQKIKFNSIEPGRYESTGIYAPSSSGNHQINVRISTNAGNSDDSTSIYVREIAIYKVLMILACPQDLYDPNTHLPNVNDWYSWELNTGTPNWYKNLEKDLFNYYGDISYGQVLLGFETTDQWFELAEEDKNYTPLNRTNMIKLRDHAINEAGASGNYQISEYDLFVVIDPTNIIHNSGKWQGNSGLYTFDSNTPPEPVIISSTPYNNGDNANEVIIDLIDHEITHAIDLNDDGRNVINLSHGDNNHDTKPCLMCPNNKGEHQPFNPVNAWKMGFSNYDAIGVWYKVHRTLYPIEEGRDRAIYIKMDKNGIEYNYWIEFRDGSWGNDKKGVLIWRSEDNMPYTDALPNWDHPQLAEKISSDWNTFSRNLYHDEDTGFELRVTKITDDYANIEVNSASDVFTTVQNVSGNNYSIEMQIIGNFFTNCTYYFSVLDTLDQSEVFNFTLTTNTDGFFDSPIIFNDTITDNIEAHPYLIRVHTVSGWVEFLIATPSLIDGILNENPFFIASDPAETNTAGDLTNLTSTSGSMKLSLKTAMPVDTSSYKYVVYLDSDNSTATGFSINTIGADYKIEYTGSGTRLYNYSTSWIVVDTPFLNASHNGTNIEILTSTEIMNSSGAVKLVAQTIDGSEIVYDTLPDPISPQPYLQFFDVHPMDIQFNQPEYYIGDTVTVNGYGFAPNQIIPIAIKNQTDHIIWEGSVQADSNGLVINSPTWTVPVDFEGSAYLYWLGAQMDSFSRAVPQMPVYHADFDLNTPMVVGIGREFNVTVNFENVGDDLTNLTLNLNTSGMTSVPKTIIVGDLTSGENYTHTWDLTSTAPGFALFKAEMQSDQTIFMTRQIGTYIANISVGIHALNDTVNGGTFEFNVSATNNQENITYTDLLVNTSIRNLETNFSQPLISLTPNQTINLSYSRNTTGVASGTYEIVANVMSSEEILTIDTRTVSLSDFTPPSPITNPQSTPGTTWLNWTWTNPSDPDFNYTEIYLNGTFITNIPAPQNYYNATGLLPDTSYELGTHTVDTAGNVNETWVNDTASTLPASTLNLYTGWNLISLPLMPEDTGITSLLFSINGNYSIVWAYDANDTTDHWKKYDPVAPFGNDLTSMEPGKGYWIMMTNNDTLPITGTAPESIDLKTGWNLIGYNSFLSQPITDALYSIDGNYSIVWAYNASDAVDHWKKYDPLAPFGNDLSIMEPDKGYWIMMMVDDIL